MLQDSLCLEVTIPSVYHQWGLEPGVLCINGRPSPGSTPLTPSPILLSSSLQHASAVWHRVTLCIYHIHNPSLAVYSLSSTVYRNGQVSLLKFSSTQIEERRCLSVTTNVSIYFRIKHPAFNSSIPNDDVNRLVALIHHRWILDGPSRLVV